MRELMTWQKIGIACVLVFLVFGSTTAESTANLINNNTPTLLSSMNILNNTHKQTMSPKKRQIAQPVQNISRSGLQIKSEDEMEQSISVSAPREDQVMHTIKVIATGYTAGYESTGKKPSHPEYGITYSGVKVRRDKNTVSTIAADLKLFPLGTILYIPGYGYGVVADKGSAIKGKKIDLYFTTTKQVFAEWGKKEVEVQVIEQGNGKLTEVMLKQLGKAMEVNKGIPDRIWDEEV